MTCETARQLLPLLLYGELSFEEENGLEQHLDDCESCRAARGQEEHFQAIVNQGEVELPAGLLARNRRALAGTVASETYRFTHPSWWARLGAVLSNPPAALKPVGALALIAVGFGLARTDVAGVAAARLTGRGAEPPAISKVRTVSNDSSGLVRVAYDEVRPRVVVGGLNDESIRRVLLAAASDPADPGLRVESIDLLKSSADDEAVRRALLNAVQTDRNSGVRLKSLEGLKAYAKDADTRKVLRHVLLSDNDPAVRATAIDLLVQSRGPETAGFLQELLPREQQNYVRARCKSALSEMKASVGTF